MGDDGIREYLLKYVPECFSFACASSAVGYIIQCICSWKGYVLESILLL